MSLLASGGTTDRPTADEISGTLQQHEQPWADRQIMLEARGYMLRRRYRLDWVPSWRGTGEHPLEFEDGLVAPVSPMCAAP